MLKLCVIGMGAMGRNHMRVLSELPGTKLVAASDPMAEVHSAAKRYGCTAYSDHLEMLDKEKPDAVVISVPTDLHMAVSLDAMSRGVHVLVEKPMASTLEEADRMIEAARKYKVILSVGHIERFNPAVQELRRRVQAGEIGRIFQLHARRLSPFPSRIQDVGVILDLATHDIDAMHFVTGSTVMRAYAETARKAHKTCEDMLCGLLRFQTGEVGVLDVSWLSPQKLRELSVIGEGGMLVVDYLSQDLRFYKNGRVNDTWEPATHFSGAVEGDMIRSYIPKKEPLRSELESFVNAVRENSPAPVGGDEGRAALKVALDLMASGADHQISIRPPPVDHA